MDADKLSVESYRRIRQPAAKDDPLDLDNGYDTPLYRSFYLQEFDESAYTDEERKELRDYIKNKREEQLVEEARLKIVNEEEEVSDHAMDVDEEDMDDIKIDNETNLVCDMY